MVKAFCNIYAQFDQTRDRLPLEISHLLGLGLVCDTSVSFGQIERFPEWIKRLQNAGGLIAPNIYPHNLDESCHDSNWWKYSETECLRLLTLAKERFESYGLGKLLAVNTYTPGNSFVDACRKLGVRYILGFCAPTVIEDGGWRIAHYGSPLAPYFISDEDFRKPEAPGARPDPVMMMSMEMRNPLVCLSHWSEGPWCPLNALAADRSLEPSDRPVPFLTIADDWIRQGRLSGKRMFFQINLQYFFTEKCFDHNRRALEWLAARRSENLLDIGSGQEWAELSRQSGGMARQTSYWRGEMPGFHVGNRAGIYPDVVVDEKLDGQVAWRSPDALPKRFYDYHKKWDYPAFVPDGTAPTSEDFSDCRTEVHSEETDETCVTKVKIVNNGTARPLRLMLWDALGLGKAPFELKDAAGWQFQAIPHPSGTGGAILAEGTAPAGVSSFELRAKAQARGRGCSRRWGGLLAAETFFMDGRPFTMLTAQAPETFCVQVAISPPRFTPETDSPELLNAQDSARLESLRGIEYRTGVIGREPIPLTFDGTRLACWHRLWDVTAEQLVITGADDVETELRRKTHKLTAELMPELEIPAPGYQVFGPLTDKSRWEIALGRAAGKRELKRMSQWFTKQRPNAGEIVIEAHPGLFLPRGGSITKTLGHDFDLIRCADEYGFEELCADYPQAWDWGVGGWIQWRHLRICLKGLKGGRHVLHLHAFDPEARGSTLRIHAYDADNPKNMELCLRPDWPLPSGLEGRWNDGALCSVELPAVCGEWSSVGIWINPLEKSRLYDWIAERGSPGMFSHLWLTRSDK